MADEKSPVDEDVMKDAADASETQDETSNDEVVADDTDLTDEDGVESADAEDGDSASLETQVEELRGTDPVSG